MIPSSSKRLISALAIVLPVLLFFAPPLPAAPNPEPFSVGNIDEGFLQVSLYRGAAVPFELTVIATPDDCQGELRLRISWSKADNLVQIKLTGGKDALEPFPDIERTEGEDFLPNPFFLEPEDYEDGRYQLWLIGGSGPIVNFFYDPVTLDLLGSEFDFEVPPSPVVAPFPTLFMFATPFFQPDVNGRVNLKWSFPYNGAIRGDRPEFSYHIVTFPPPNLCLANPFRLDLSTLRPYITDPFPAAEARPWSDYLKSGMLFDVTVEPPEYFEPEAPKTSLAATYSGGTVIGGGIPRGWTFDIPAAFAGVAPPIKPWPGQGECANHFAGFHDSGINFCPELAAGEEAK